MSMQFRRLCGLEKITIRLTRTWRPLAQVTKQTKVLALPRAFGPATKASTAFWSDGRGRFPWVSSGPGSINEYAH